MQISNMREFIALSEIGNYQIASEKLFISQSTLSKHIKEMENILGGKLFNRLPRKIELTELGNIFLPYARKMVSTEDNCLSIISSYMKKIEKTIRIGMISHSKEEKITRLLIDFQTNYKNFSINIIYQESETLFQMLKNDSVDFILIREKKSIKNNEYDRLNFYNDELTAYACSTNKFAKNTFLNLIKLKNEALLFSEESSLSYIFGTQACRNAGFEPNIFFKGNRIQTMNYVRQDLGIALMLGNGLTDNLESDIVSIPIIPKISIPVNFLYKKNILNCAQKKFLSFLVKYLSTNRLKNE
ncbi:LysR family transcriptional regulator [Oenococcus sp. UCMA 17063]|nr:LysR family transcriptional regulator [Oenococcus sp. UCMA 17063]